MLPPAMPRQRMCKKCEQWVEARISPRTCSIEAALSYTSFDRSEYAKDIKPTPEACQTMSCCCQQVYRDMYLLHLNFNHKI